MTDTVVREEAPTARRRPRISISFVTAAAMVIVGIQLLARGWVGFRGYFSLDDFVFYRRAAENPFWSADFLFKPYNGHVMPGGMAWAWITTHAAPLSFSPVFTVILVLQGLVSVSMYAVLRTLFGSRLAVLPLLTVFCFTSITLPGMLWWAAAINQLPEQLFVLLAILAHLRLVRTGRWQWGVGTAAMTLCGLAFSEKTALVLPLLFVLSWLFFSTGDVWASALATIRRYWTSWVGLLVVLVPYAIYYVVTVPTQARSGQSLGGTLDLADIMIRRTVIPGALGGPWRWEPVGWVDGAADPNVLAQILSVVVVAAVVVLSVQLRTGAWRAWAFVLAALGAEVALLAATRAQVLVSVGAEYRYVTDFAIALVIGLGCAFLPISMPTRDAKWVGEPRPLRVPEELRTGLAAVNLPVLAIALMVALVVSSFVSLERFGERWTDNPAKGYFANAVPQAKQLGSGDRLYDGTVPTSVVWQLLWPSNVPSRLLRPTGVRAMPLRNGSSARELWHLTKDGELEAVRIDKGVFPATRQTPDCAVELRNSQKTVPLMQTTFGWDWIVQIDYTASGNGIMDIAAGGRIVPAEVRAGTHRVYAAVNGALSKVVLKSQLPGNAVCVHGLVVGLPQPVEW